MVNKLNYLVILKLETSEGELWTFVFYMFRLDLVPLYKFLCPIFIISIEQQLNSQSFTPHIKMGFSGKFRLDCVDGAYVAMKNIGL